MHERMVILKKPHSCIRGFVVFINQSACGPMEFVALLYPKIILPRRTLEFVAFFFIAQKLTFSTLPPCSYHLTSSCCQKSLP